MTHSTREEAARAHAESEGDNGNAEISPLAGAEYEAPIAEARAIPNA